MRVGPAAHHPGEDAVRRAEDSLGLDLTNSTRLRRPSLCACRSSVGDCRTTKPALKMQRCSNCGATSERPDPGMASCTTFEPLDMLLPPSHRRIVATSTMPALCVVQQRRKAFFVTVPSRTSAQASICRPETVHHLRPRPCGTGTTSGYASECAHSSDRESGKTRVFISNSCLASGRHHLTVRVYKSRWQGNSSSIDQASRLRMPASRSTARTSEIGRIRNLACRCSVYRHRRRHRSRSASTWTVSRC